MSNLSPDDDQTQPAPISSAERDAMEARRGSPREILLLLMLLLVLMLIAFATGRGMLIRFGGPSSPSSSTAPASTSGAIGQGSPPAVGRDQLAAMEAARPPDTLAAVCSPPGGTQRVSPRFRLYYDQHGRVETFGLPISQEISDNGRIFQWFERARLEYHPEHAGTQHEIVGGLVGVEFTKGIVFPQQAFFVSRPGARYFGETRHGVRDPFLSFWEQNGGLDIFGYPISDEVQERLPEDKQPHTVQYFERVRLEYHPEDPNAPVQIGLLGRARCLEQSKPDLLPTARPTPVPMP